ncbi:MAG TPA: hypothetical protein VIQ30_26215 [Pseudonocardia sp.]
MWRPSYALANRAYLAAQRGATDEALLHGRRAGEIAELPDVAHPGWKSHTVSGMRLRPEVCGGLAGAGAELLDS